MAMSEAKLLFGNLLQQEGKDKGRKAEAREHAGKGVGREGKGKRARGKECGRGKGLAAQPLGQAPYTNRAGHKASSPQPGRGLGVCWQR